MEMHMNKIFKYNITTLLTPKRLFYISKMNEIKICGATTTPGVLYPSFTLPE